MIQITGTKNREETLGLIAKTWQKADVASCIEIMQPNDRGGKTLEKTLRAHFPEAVCDSRQKSRFIILMKTENTPPIIDEWMAHAALHLVEETGFYSMPGLFGWNKIDKGSALLVETLLASNLKGKGADFGCGYGYLSKKILENFDEIEKFYGLDLDPRAVEASQKNILDDRAEFTVADCTQVLESIGALDFIVMNPPFHDQGNEDRTMGQRFIEIAARHLRRSGALWIVSNTHMPYEKTLQKLFKSFEIVEQKNGFKIIRALK
ncbi:MAG: methyltransferase [Alphaproteobacteria bacterium]|nr:MAG: methyltransferase [Alphaproteobacteria bacterium]